MPSRRCYVCYLFPPHPSRGEMGPARPARGRGEDVDLVASFPLPVWSQLRQPQPTEPPCHVPHRVAPDPE